MKSFYLGIGFMLFATNALANNQLIKIDGGMDSGGGKGVVCFNHATTNSKVISQNRAIYDEDLEDIKSIAMLDLQYSIDSFGLEQLVGHENNSDERSIYIRAINNKLEFAPDLQNRVQANYLAVVENRRMRNAPLKGTFDENDIALYENSNCVLTQLAVQQDISPKQVIVHIDSRLFNHKTHSELSKFSLILHEGIYYFLRRNADEKNSAFTRELVATIIHNQKESGENFIQKFIDSGFLVGAPKFSIENGGYGFMELLSAVHYIKPNAKILKYALDIPAQFSTTFFNISFVSALTQAGWVTRASDALGKSDYPSVMYKKLNALKENNNLAEEYRSIFNDFAITFNEKLEKDIEGMRKDYIDSTDEDKNEERFALMLNSLRILAKSYAQLYLQDSIDVEKINKQLPIAREELIKILGQDLFSRVESVSPFFMKPVSRFDQIPETHSYFSGNMPTKLDQAKGTNYYNFSFMLHFYEALGANSFQEQFFDSITVPEV
jgi:hypothetical protein